MRLQNYITEGFTRYWEGNAFTDDEWSKITKGTKKIIANAEKKKIKIMGSDGTGKPIISSTEILLNGDEKTDNSYETFHLLKKVGTKGRFCKTAKKPYDKVVMSILALAHDICPGFKIMSDDKKLEKNLFK